MDAPESTSNATARRRSPWIWIGAVVAVVVLVVGGLVFQPWLLFVDDVVDEDVPTAASQGPDPSDTEDSAASDGSAPSEDSAPSGDPAASEGATAEDSAPADADAPSGPVELASGTFITHEHGTEGTARVLQLEDGSRVLVLEDLETSNGPDLKVWLTDQPVIEGRDGWGVFDDGEWTSLGPLKGNVGTQQYEIPDDLDLSTITSVSIWCEQFSVSFGAAKLDLG